MGQPIIQFVSEHQTQLWSLGLVVFTAFVGNLFRWRPRLRYSIDHSSNILVDQPLFDNESKQIAASQIVRTASITIQNMGLQAARAVEVTFNWKPPIFNVTPARAFTEVESPFNRHSLKFDSLAPSERTTIDIMSINGDLPLLTGVRSDDCVGKQITMVAQRQYPTWFNLTTFVIFLVGAASVLYLTIVGIQALASRS